MTGAAVWRIMGSGTVAFAVLILAFLILPTFVILPLSFSSESYLSFPPPGFSLQWYQAFIESHDYRMAIFNSVKIGLPAAGLATVTDSEPTPSMRSSISASTSAGSM